MFGIRSLEWRPLLFLVYLGASWGLYFSLLKIAVNSGISYPGIAALTTGGVGAGMLLIAARRRRWPEFGARHQRFYAIAALTGYLVPFLVELAAIGHMPAGVLTLIVAMSPVATLSLAWVMRSDRIDVARVGGIGLGAVAIFAILLPDAHANAGVGLGWLLLAALVPLSYAFYHNYISLAWPPGSDSFQLACGEAIYATVILFVLAAFGWQWQDLQGWNSGHTAIVVMASIALIDVYIYFELIRVKGPVYCSHANYFMVASGVFWGMVFFAERPGPWMWLSVILLVLSLYLIGRRQPEEIADAEKN